MNSCFGHPKANKTIPAQKYENKDKGEIQVVQELITALGLQDVVFSFDSLHCQKKLAK
jgi:hypothetical protein